MLLRSSLLAFALVFASTFTTTAHAQSPDAQPASMPSNGATVAPTDAPADAGALMMVTSVDLPFLTGLVEARGHSVEQAVTRLNEAVVVAFTETGLRYVLVGMNCRAPDAVDCRGLQMMMILVPMGGPDLEEMNILNYNRAAVSVWRSPEGQDAETPLPPEYGVNRYVILDHGVSAKNIDVNLGVFLQAAQSVKDAIER